MSAHILIVHSSLGTEFVCLRGDSTEDLSRGPQLSLLYTPRRIKDVSRSEATFLVGCAEERDRTICGEVFSVSASEG